MFNKLIQILSSSNPAATLISDQGEPTVGADGEFNNAVPGSVAPNILLKELLEKGFHTFRFEMFAKCTNH